MEKPLSIDLKIFGLTILIGYILISLTSLLPLRYYFQFSSLLEDSEEVAQLPRTTPMLIGPDLPVYNSYCLEVLEVKKEKYYTQPKLIEACNRLNQFERDEEYFVPYDAKVEGNDVFPLEFQALLVGIRNQLKEIVETEKQKTDPESKVLVKALRKLEIKDIDFGLRSLLTSLDDQNNDNGIVDEESSNEIAPNDNSNPSANEEKNIIVDLILNTVDEVNDSSAIRNNIKLRILGNYKIKEYSDSYLDLREIAEGRDPRIEKSFEYYVSLSKSADIKFVASSIVKNDNFSFVVSIILKLMPAFLAGIVVCMASKTQDFMSASFAMGSLAFILCWPVILLWDSVVSSAWQDSKLMFYILYGCYIIGYFTSCYVGCAIGTKMLSTLDKGMQPISLDWPKVIGAAISTTLTSLVTALVTWGFASAQN